MARPGGHLFESASNVRIDGGTFMGVGTYIEATVVQDDPFKLLYEGVSPNAILNSGGRADSVQCYPGTREEVISRIRSWMKDGYRSNRAIFWLSGPAGAGKSAIIQSIAEGCLQHNVPMANFFFFRADSSRNHTRPLVPTILSQLFDLYPALKADIREIIKEKPIILRQSMRDQFLELVNAPVVKMCSSSQVALPLVFLIDGLDECNSEYGKNDQIALLRILHDLVTQPDSPFIVLVASRTEPHITMAFNEIGACPDSIFLDEAYRPEDDIRRFLVGELSRIKRTHALYHTLNAGWPPDAAVDNIIQKSSGQFIYAATVTRFVGSSPASPAVSMQIVLGIRAVKKDSPFAEIDAIYTYILSQIDDWDSVLHILAVHRIMSSFSQSQYLWTDNTDPLIYLKAILLTVGYPPEDVASALSDLTAIVRFNAESFTLHFYHASFQDFLYDKARGGTFFIDLGAIATKFVPLLFRNMSDIRAFVLAFHFFKHVNQLDEFVDSALQTCVPTFTLPSFVVDHNQTIAHLFFDKIGELYQGRDPQLVNSVSRRWYDWFYRSNRIFAAKSELPPLHDIQKQTPHRTRFQRLTTWFSTAGSKRRRGEETPT